MQLHRSERDKVIGGVCGGLAESLSIETVYIRLAFLLFAIYAGNGLLVYLILWIVLPRMEAGDNDVRYHRLYRPRTDRMIGGVCSGIANAVHTDASIVRLIFIAMTVLGGGGIVVYLLLWLVIPLEPEGFEL
ncbi:MAG: hypothetical protein CVU50_00310 [Candidatus Cloacimonetes bacterium HGW-Cloacimonetes-3]|jgi:phage shock protein PspC (stress-responsive transcriptional regulator)|nr:MAG: hypothetical protein CVU50_00310 [Candidatus Cloacimonetes bacterium HGW-Cloacimonetes-3]